MGWTSLNLRGQAPLDYIRNECLTWGPSRPCRYTVLAMTQLGTVVYGAVEKIHKETGDRQVFAIVFLTSRKWSDGSDFGYKDMDETCGPVESRCPVKILSLLTPTDSQYANDWRTRCRSYHAMKKDAAKKGKGLAENDLITFSKPLSFGSFEASRFQLLDKAKGHYMALYGETGMTKVKLSRALVSKSLLTGYATLDLSPTLSTGSSGLAPTLAVMA